MSEIVIEMDVRVTKVLKNVPECFDLDKDKFRKIVSDSIKAAGYDNAIVDDIKRFELVEV